MDTKWIAIMAIGITAFTALGIALSDFAKRPGPLIVIEQKR